MKNILFINFLMLLFSSNLNAQLLHKNILTLKGNYRVHQDTCSESYLQKYKHLPDLLVQVRDNYEHDDLKIFNNVSNLKKLSIHSNSVTSLQGLEQLQLLESLAISKSPVQDFTPIRNLRSLKKLSINSTFNIDFPLKFDLLEELDYSCNFDLNNCEFPNLEKITIHQAVAFDYQYEDYKNYGIKYNLEKACCPINLSKLKRLNTVNIYNLQIQNINEITFPKGVKNIQINNCGQLKNIDGLETLKDLETLSIKYCSNIQDFEIISKLNNVEWTIRYMGKVFQNRELNSLLNHPDNFYYYANDPDEHAEKNFYNFHTSVVEKAKITFKKYHQLILSEKLSREEFLDMIGPLINELDDLCTEETCNIDWSDEESFYLIEFLNDMSQLAGHVFDESHFYTRYEWEFR